MQVKSTSGGAIALGVMVEITSGHGPHLVQLVIVMDVGLAAMVVAVKGARGPTPSSPPLVTVGATMGGIVVARSRLVAAVRLLATVARRLGQ